MREDIRESLKHWFRMRRACRKIIDKKMGNCPSLIEFMRDMCGETYGANDCTLCQKYFSNKIFPYCAGCPLFETGNGCFEDGSIYTNVADSTDWHSWYKNSSQMIKSLWGLRNYKERGVK